MHLAETIIGSHFPVGGVSPVDVEASDFLHYHSCLLTVLDPSFSEHSQVCSP
jgi:hypothetical protein